MATKKTAKKTTKKFHRTSAPKAKKVDVTRQSFVERNTNNKYAELIEQVCSLKFKPGKMQSEGLQVEVPKGLTPKQYHNRLASAFLRLGVQDDPRLIQKNAWVRKRTTKDRKFVVIYFEKDK